MKIKTSQLEGSALDWAVAKASNAPDEIATKIVTDGHSPSGDWREGGPVIEKCKIETGPAMNGWFALSGNGAMQYGSTILVAAMRAIVASELGDEVDIPGELTK